MMMEYLPDFVKKTLNEVDAKGLRRKIRPVQRISPRECRIQEKTFLDFSSNDYMGFSTREELRAGAADWLNQYGAGSGAARLISGTTDACMELEERIARWKGFEAALLIGSGYMANLGVTEALASRDSVIFADKLNHASINRGCVLSQAKFLRYKHNDMNHLSLLAEHNPCPDALLVSDTIFSMDGDLAPLTELAELAQKNRMVLYLDDAHGSGVFGPRGKGLTSPDLCTVALTTFSKAMGSYGAAVTCSREMKDYFINRCAPFIFSTALAPAVLGAISAAVDLIQTEESQKARERLLARSKMVRDELTAMGYQTGKTQSMIIPVIAGTPEKTAALSRELAENGIYALAVRPPTVPQGTSRIRLSLNATHTDSDLEQMLSAFRRAGQRLAFF